MPLSMPGWLSRTLVLFACVAPSAAIDLQDGAYQVFPGDDLQSAVDQAADNPTIKIVRVHPGVYAPRRRSPALVYLNRRHDGIHLEGIQCPTLTAANAAISDPKSPSFPAIVNHVLYLGDGLSSNTIICNLKLTGANHFVTTGDSLRVEPDQMLRKGRFYFGDGGAIKIYHRSYPVLRHLEIVGNYASPCAGGISIQHEGATNGMVWIENCVFRNNRSEVTGAALDLLWGSSAHLVNCLFEGNISNTGPGEGENPFNNNGAVTVFPRSRVYMEHCTLTGNRNGVDDSGGLSEYSRCIFAGNTQDGGFTQQSRYELDLAHGGSVYRCRIEGILRDPTHAVKLSENIVRETTDLIIPPPLNPSPDDTGYHPPTSVSKAPPL